jgi:signal transduction histidine kinase
MRIRSHLLLIALLAGIPGLVVATCLMWWSAQLQRASLEEGIRETAHALSQAVDRELARGQGIALAIAASPAIDIGRFDRVHTQAAALTDPSEWVVLAKADGSQVLNSLRPYGVELPRAASIEVIEKVAQTGVVQFGNLVVGAVAGRPIITVGAPVIRDGQVRYVALFASGVERFQSLLQSQPMPTGWIASILDGNRITIARNRDPGRWVAKPTGPALRPLIEQAKDGTSSGVSREGVSLFFSWTTSPSSSWAVAVGAPTEIVNAPMRTMFILFAIAVLFLLACISAALIIGRRVNQRITESVDQLAHAAMAMGHGAPVDLDRGPNISEIDAVSKSLRWASETIHARALEQERAWQEAVEVNHAKDEFIATLAHEVRSPLAAISAATESLEHITPRRETAIIKRQVNHLTALVNELFDGARIAMNKFVLVREPMNLTEAIRHCIDSMSFDRDRYLVNLEASEDVWIEGDETRIQQVISNLVTNAIKFTPKGGTINVCLRRRLDSAIIEVTDPGIGISSSLMPRLFELFVQGDRLEAPSTGLGIGLSLVRRLVELHGGTVTAYSEGRDKGSTFTVTLPCIEHDTQTKSAAA